MGRAAVTDDEREQELRAYAASFVAVGYESETQFLLRRLDAARATPRDAPPRLSNVIAIATPGIYGPACLFGWDGQGDIWMTVLSTTLNWKRMPQTFETGETT